jgi:hypothetical protein
MLSFNTSTYIDFLHGYENLLAKTKFVKEWSIQRNTIKEIEVVVIVDESYNPQDLYNLYMCAQLLGSMAIKYQNFNGAHCYIRDQKSKQKLEGFDDVHIMQMDDRQSIQSS